MNRPNPAQALIHIFEFEFFFHFSCSSTGFDKIDHRINHEQVFNLGSKTIHNCL